MEHLLFHLIFETITAIDRRLQRPLNIAIPELGRLRSDPLSRLARSPVQIGPRRRHALATVIGLLAGITVVIILFVLLAHAPRRGRVDWSRIAGVLFSFGIVIAMVRSLMMRLLLGGRATLRLEGVELTYRDRTVFLPWMLFRANGTIFEPDASVAVLPIDPNIPVAVSGPGDQMLAMLPANLELPQAASSDFGQLALKDMYEVRVGDLAVLLNQLARRLHGDAFEQDDTETSPVPLAVPQQDGWLSIQLTQLPFPPYCASCGDATNSSLVVPIVKVGQVGRIAVPFCNGCGRARTRRRIIGAAIGAAAGIVAAVLLASWIGGNANADAFVLALIALVPAVVVPATIIGQLIGRDICLPVRCKDYQPDKGSVRIRLRDPVRAAPLLHAMGLTLNTEPDPEPALN